MTTSSLDPALIQIGQHGAPAEILSAARGHLTGEWAMAALWEGARRRRQESIIKGMEQQSAVLDTALSGPPFPFTRIEELSRMMHFAGYQGEDHQIIQCGARAQAHPLLVQALLGGAEVREHEHLANGIRRKHTVCRAVVANLPQHRLKIEPSMEIVVECMAKIGTEDEIAEIAKRYGHDDYTGDFMARAAEEAERTVREKAGTADLIRHVFTTTPVLAAHKPAPTVIANQHPLGLKKSTLRL